MKVNDLKPQKLEEGFLDNLITKVQDLAGGDGLTGVVRSLRGQGAALNRVADAIKNGFTGTLRRRLGNNFNAVAAGQAEVPAADIIKLAFKAAEAISDKDNNPVSAAQLVDFFKKNKRVITTTVGGGVASVVDAIVDVANRQQIEAPMPYEQFIDGVAKSMASAIILIQTADEAGDAGEMDPNDIDQFEQQGNAVLSTLLDATKGLQPNQDYKDNIENLFFVQMVKVVKDKYVSLPNEQLVKLAETPPPLVNIVTLKNYLTAHNPSLDQTVVSNVTREAHSHIQEQFKHWLKLAAQETSTGAKAEQSLQLYSTWLQKADNMLNSLKIGNAQQSTPQDDQQAGKTIPPAGSKGIVFPNGTVVKPGTEAYNNLIQIAKDNDVQVESKLTKGKLLTEAKARIDHPEDLVFEEGSAGALRALNAILHAGTSPESTTVKWDGSPAIIFGRDENGFVLTDKAGFGAKKYDGMARSETMFRDMIYNRKPDQTGRLEYATELAKLFPYLENAVPKRFKGFIQGDIMWMHTPIEHNGKFEIKPNKVKYTIAADSEFGKRVKKSVAGVVVHSIFDSPADPEPRAIESFDGLGLKPTSGLIIMSPELPASATTFTMPVKEVNQIKKFISSKGPAIDKLLDNMSMGAMKISNLPDIFKSYLNHRAGLGEHGFMTDDFLQWMRSPASKLTASKQANVLAHIESNKDGFESAFKLANALVNLKYHLKDQLDQHAGGDISAELAGAPGHEGFVSDTPHGKIKLVNRPVFMKKV